MPVCRFPAGIDASCISAKPRPRTDRRPDHLALRGQEHVPSRSRLDEDVNALLRLKGGGKGMLAISQVGTGEENGLTLRVYASDGAIKMEPGESELS
jgi:hypothetical protein